MDRSCFGMRWLCDADAPYVFMIIMPPSIAAAIPGSVAVFRAVRSSQQRRTAHEETGWAAFDGSTRE